MSISEYFHLAGLRWFLFLLSPMTRGLLKVLICLILPVLGDYNNNNNFKKTIIFSKEKKGRE